MDKKITYSARMMIRCVVVGLFLLVWAAYYGKLMFHTHYTVGVLICTLIYYLVYNAICKNYNAFRIASTSLSELLLAHTIAFGIADMIFYAEACITCKALVNILPGLIVAGFQILFTFLIIKFTQQYFQAHVPPKMALFIYGKDVEQNKIDNCIRELKTNCPHLFNIEKIINEDESIPYLCQNKNDVDVCILFQVSSDNRRVLINKCAETDIEFYFTPRISDMVLQGCSPRHIVDTPFMKYDLRYEKTGYQHLKRILDIIFALLILIPAAPVMLITAIAIKLEDHGPALFKQKRYTKDKKIFEILKFRSMVVDADKYGVVPTTEKDPRITKVGAFIRATRIDELPQLINILKGDMSFVGPRPERIEHVDEYSKDLPEFLYRLKVKGGLTGYAQIYGKYNTSAYDKLRMDLYYIENQSLLMDLKLVLLTIRTVFEKESTEGFSEEKAKEMTEHTKSNIVVSLSETEN